MHYTDEKLKYKINKYQAKLQECNMVNDAEIYKNKIIEYEKKLKCTPVQNGGSILHNDFQIYGNMLNALYNLDNSDIKDTQKVTNEFNKLSQEGKNRYKRIYEQSLNLFKN